MKKRNSDPIVESVVGNDKFQVTVSFVIGLEWNRDCSGPYSDSYLAAYGCELHDSLDGQLARNIHSEVCNRFWTSRDVTVKVEATKEVHDAYKAFVAKVHDRDRAAAEAELKEAEEKVARLKQKLR